MTMKDHCVNPFTVDRDLKNVIDTGREEGRLEGVKQVARQMKTAGELVRIEDIVQHSKERYVDTATDRRIAVGRCERTLVLVPYETGGNVVTPITIHATTRQQIAFRLKTGRFVHE